MSGSAKGDVQLTPEWRAADDLAKAMFEQRFPGAPWRGRKTNRAYWRRLAKGELHRAAKVPAPSQPGTAALADVNHEE